MIKNYLELNKTELEKFIEFENRNKEDKLSFDELDKAFRSEEFDFGNGVIIKTKEGYIVGRVSIILRECDKKGIAYVIQLDINEKVENKKMAASELIKEAKNISRRHGAQKIFIGSGDLSIIKIFNSLNLYKQYSMVEMTLADRESIYKPLKSIALSDSNKKEYLRIYNDAFKEVPNGATVTECEIDEYIKKADMNNCFYIITVNDDMVGFLQFKIEDGIGEFDLGLTKSARGNGYGKQLLETAISLLNLKEVKEIRLIAATRNVIAYDMYKKRGFKESKLLSDWYELQ